MATTTLAIVCLVRGKRQSQCKPDNQQRFSIFFFYFWDFSFWGSSGALEATSKQAGSGYERSRSRHPAIHPPSCPLVVAFCLIWLPALACSTVWLPWRVGQQIAATRNWVFFFGFRLVCPTQSLAGFGFCCCAAFIDYFVMDFLRLIWFQQFRTQTIYALSLSISLNIPPSISFWLEQ